MWLHFCLEHPELTGNNNMKNEDIMDKIIELIASNAVIAEKTSRIERTLDDLSKKTHDKMNELASISLVKNIQECQENLEDRVSAIEKERADNSAIKSNHKAIAGFFLANWKFLVSFLGIVSICIGSIDVALKVPSKDQNTQIRHLQHEISKNIKAKRSGNP